MASKKPIAKESEEDLLLKQELLSLVEKLKGKNEALYLPALESLQNLLKTPAASMTSIPKPRKYLVEYYSDLKECHKKFKDKAKKLCADIISVVSLAVLDKDVKTNRECLNYCLMGNMQNMSDLGHEYFRQLEEEIIDEYVVNSSRYAELQPLIHKIIDFDCKNHDEIQACDLLMEVDKIELLADHITPDMYDRICLYLTSCSPYVDETELSTLLNFAFSQYYKYNEYIKCLMVAMKLQNDELIKKVIDSCSDPLILKQMAYIAGRQQVVLNFKDDLEDKEDLENITCNGHLNKLFFSFTTELDIREPKSPEEIFKNWEISYPRREVVDSSKQNLASTFVNAFVNAGFGTDKLLTGNDANFWIFRHKEHAMLSATASLGLIHLWDVDGGLTPIDKFLYSEDPYIKAGALLGIGIVNCRVRNECDPAFALLSEYVGNPNSYLQLGAIFGLGLAYAGTQREDVLKLLLGVMFKDDVSVEVLSVACVSCGLIAVSSCNADVTNAIMQMLIENNAARIFQNPYGKLLVLGLGLCYMGRKDAIEAPVSALEVLGEPVRSTAQTILQMCGYAGTGDVLVIQELLHACGEQGDDLIQPPKPKSDPKEKESKGKEGSSNNTSKKPPTVKPSVMFSAMRALAGLGIAVVALGEDIGKEMCPKICTHMGRYGDVVTRKVVPLAVALCSISNPQMSIVNILHKFSHDGDNEVACNAIFALGLVGAGSNNARLTTMFRQLAEYHRRNPSQLFMVRVASGLNKLGKGTLTLNPLHTDKQLFSTTALAGLLITTFAMIDNATVLFSKGHYFLYALTTAIQPRWLITVDENMEKICVPVRIGQAVDVVGKAGIPKAISGFHTQTTPVLLALGERAELATDQYEPLSPYMEGVVVLKKKQEL